MVRHAEEKFDCTDARLACSGKRLSCDDSVLPARTVWRRDLSADDNTLHSINVRHPLTVSEAMGFKRRLRYRQPACEKTGLGFNRPGSLLRRYVIDSRLSNSSDGVHFFLFSKIPMIDREKEPPNWKRFSVPFRQQRHGACDFGHCCHDESHITAGFTSGFWFDHRRPHRQGGQPRTTDPAQRLLGEGD